MKGFVGVVDWEARLPADLLTAHVRVDDGAPREWLADPRGAFVLGRAHLGIFQPAPQLGGPGPVHVLLDGELANGPSVARDLGVTADRAADAPLVAAIYGAAGLAGLARLRGAFAAAIVDGERGQVVLVADRLGSHPLYWQAEGSRLSFASDLATLLALRRTRAALDPRALADYISFGFVTRTNTLAAGVAVVGPGTTVSWSRDRGLRVETYAKTVDFFERRERSEAAYTAEVVDAFGAAVTRSTGQPGPLGMSLSGGLDSRAILSALGATARTADSYTLGVSGCADEVVAGELARLAGTRHTFYELDASYLKDFLGQLREMVRLTDGMYLSHGLTEMLALQFLRRAPFRVLLRGHGGELAKTSLAWPLHTDQTIYGMRSSAEFVDHLLKRLTYVAGGLDWLSAFTETWRTQMEGAARASLDEIVRDVPLSPPELCGYLYLREHHRRFTVPSIELFRNTVEVRMPFADEEFLPVLLSGRPEWRDSTALHRAIIARHDARLLRVRDSNTGAPVDAGRLRGLVGDKLNSLFKRLNVPGYRHYHNFDAWMEQMLVEAVESELLAPRSLDRGILKADRLRALLDGAKRGERGYAYLLQVLLIVELWQQQNVDADQPRGSVAVAAADHSQ